MVLYIIHGPCLVEFVGVWPTYPAWSSGSIIMHVYIRRSVGTTETPDRMNLECLEVNMLPGTTLFSTYVRTYSKPNFYHMQEAAMITTQQQYIYEPIHRQQSWSSTSPQAVGAWPNIIIYTSNRAFIIQHECKACSNVKTDLVQLYLSIHIRPGSFSKLFNDTKGDNLQFKNQTKKHPS